MPVGALVTIVGKLGSEKELQGLLNDAIADVRSEPGNMMAVVLRDPSDTCKFYVFEIYKDQAAVQAHRVAQHTIDRGPLLQALFTAPFQVKYYETVDWPETQKLPAYGIPQV